MSKSLVLFPERPKPQRAQRRIQDLIEELSLKFSPCFLNGHPKRVAQISDTVAQALKYSNEWRRMLAVTSILHDIGKVHPECQHLYTSGNLPYDEEFRKIVTAQHQIYGPKVLDAIPLHRFERFRRRIVPVCSHHHDDFRSSPRLPREVYLVAVADAWDALTSNVPGEEKERGYRQPKTLEEAAGILYEDAFRGKFDLTICMTLIQDVHGLEEPRVILPASANQSARRRSKG